MPHSLSSWQLMPSLMKHKATALLLLLVAGHAGIFLSFFLMHCTGFLGFMASMPHMQWMANTPTLIAWTMLIMQLTLSVCAFIFGFQYRHNKLFSHRKSKNIKKIRKSFHCCWRMFNICDLLESSSRSFPLSLFFGCAPPIMFFCGADAMIIFSIYLTFMIFNICVGALYAGLDAYYIDAITIAHTIRDSKQAHEVKDPTSDISGASALSPLDPSGSPRVQSPVQ